jgi:hypothetical protein
VLDLRIKDYFSSSKVIRSIVNCEQKKEELDTIVIDKDKALLNVDRLEKVIEDLSNREREDQFRLRDTYTEMLAEQQDEY